MNDQVNESGLKSLLQSNDWIRTLKPAQKRREAITLQEWSFSEHFTAMCHRHQLRNCDVGAEPPDFLLLGVAKVAVEVSRIVTPKKAAFDKSGLSGGYASTLRRSPTNREFHEQIQCGSLVDSSMIRPHFESVIDLDADYYEVAEERLVSKVQSAAHIASLYDHVLIVLSDELSEFNPTLERRLGRLREKYRSFNLPPNVEVIIMNSGLRSSVAVHVISNPSSHV